MKDQAGPLRFRGTPNRLLATLELAEGFPPARVCRVVLPDAGTLPLMVREAALGRSGRFHLEFSAP